MAYKIDYNCFSMHKKKIRNHVSAVKTISVIAILLIVFALFYIGDVQEFMIPGDPDVTKEAFAVFTEDLESGVGFQDAALSFCRQIMAYDIVE